MANINEALSRVAHAQRMMETMTRAQLRNVLDVDTTLCDETVRLMADAIKAHVFYDTLLAGIAANDRAFREATELGQRLAGQTAKSCIHRLGGRIDSGSVPHSDLTLIADGIIAHNQMERLKRDLKSLLGPQQKESLFRKVV
jgi:hypothetical protein